MRALEFKTGHMIYKPGLYLNLTDDNHPFHFVRLDTSKLAHFSSFGSTTHQVLELSKTRYIFSLAAIKGHE